MNDLNDHQLTDNSDGQMGVSFCPHYWVIIEKPFEAIPGNEHLMNGFHFLLNYYHKLSE